MHLPGRGSRGIYSALPHEAMRLGLAVVLCADQNAVSVICVFLDTG